MGCSPSKGKLFSKTEGSGSQNVLLDGAHDYVKSSAPVVEENGCMETEKQENKLSLLPEQHPMQEPTWSDLASDTTTAQNEENIKEIKVTVTPQEIVDDVVHTSCKIKKTEKRKNKGKTRYSEKQRCSILQTKVDFQPHMVKAHQAAYAFLNPNISKYETLLGMLDQAAQTQLSIKPMMSAMVLCFEEINQALEEMAEEGELMLKEHGDYMALPSGMMCPPSMQIKTSTATASCSDPPPDLLQQLLQNSTEKMKLLGGSVQSLGHATLEETVEYVSSLSKLLVEKLQAKQAVELRLANILTQVEGAAMRNPNPEDSALHSEDSGIGGENESLTGSERHRHHRGSAGSGSCGSGVNIRGTLDSLLSNSPNLSCNNEDVEQDNDDGEEYEDDEDDRPQRKRSNSSPPDTSQPLLYMHANYINDQQPTVNQPLTAVNATRPKRSSSTSSVQIMDLQKGQKDLEHQLKEMAEIQGYKELPVSHNNFYRPGLRRHSLSCSANAQKMQCNQSPCFLPILAPKSPKRPSVRRLINTFSQGVDGRSGQSLANIQPHIRRPTKGRVLLSNTVNGNEGGSVINGNNNNNSWPDGRDDLDVDNLPPPPPEVLMDNSFQSTECLQENEGGLRSLPVIIQNIKVSQRLKTCVQNVEVLPSRTSVRPRLISILPSCPRQVAVVGEQNAEQQQCNNLNPEMKKANSLYQQARKIIHLRNAAESPKKSNIVEQSSRGASPFFDRMGHRCESIEFHESEMSSCSPPVTAPPVSRVRLPPSCPSVCHRFSRPSVFITRTTSRPSSCPGTPRTVTRATDNNTEEIIPSVSFSDARSIFCQNNSRTSEPCVSSGSSVLPRPWGDTSRGRLSKRAMNNSTHRTQSEQRSSLTSHSVFPKDGSSS